MPRAAQSEEITLRRGEQHRERPNAARPREQSVIGAGNVGNDEIVFQTNSSENRLSSRCGAELLDSWGAGSAADDKMCRDEKRLQAIQTLAV